MRMMATGIDYDTQQPMFAPIAEADLASRLTDWLRDQVPAARVRDAGIKRKVEEVGRARTVDRGDPRAAGWTFLIRSDDPKRDEIIEAMAPLASWRGMPDPRQPLVCDGSANGAEWMTNTYFPLALAGQQPPEYLLIVGGPDRVPFHFQSVLDSVASVGRIDFDSTEDLRSYVTKVVRLEQAEDPVPANDTVFFGPDYGQDDPTYYSRRFLVEPLATQVHSPAIVGDQATKARLLQELRDRRPVLVFSASHGMAAPSQTVDVQRRVNGAICCAREPGARMEQWLLTADDLPEKDSFLEGAVFFQFACFGYGTPQESDYAHWLPDSYAVPQRIAKADFVSALPKRLLANPRGAIAFIGHVDTAWLHGFADPNDPRPIDRWHKRIAPFQMAVDALLKVQPPGLAMEFMNKRFDVSNAEITRTYDRVQAQREKLTPELTARLADMFILRGDAQNYMIFGDPAVRARMPAAAPSTTTAAAATQPAARQKRSRRPDPS